MTPGPLTSVGLSRVLAGPGRCPLRRVHGIDASEWRGEALFASGWGGWRGGGSGGKWGGGGGWRGWGGGSGGGVGGGEGVWGV